MIERDTDYALCKRDTRLFAWCLMCNLMLYETTEDNLTTRAVAWTMVAGHQDAFSEPHNVLVGGETDPMRHDL